MSTVGIDNCIFTNKSAAIDIHMLTSKKLHFSLPPPGAYPLKDQQVFQWSVNMEWWIMGMQTQYQKYLRYGQSLWLLTFVSFLYFVFQGQHFEIG